MSMTHTLNFGPHHPIMNFATTVRLKSLKFPKSNCIHCGNVLSNRSSSCSSMRTRHQQQQQQKMGHEDDNDTESESDLRTGLSIVFEYALKQHGIKFDFTRDENPESVPTISKSFCTDCRTVFHQLYKYYKQFVLAAGPNSLVRLIMEDSVLWKESTLITRRRITTCNTKRNESFPVLQADAESSGVDDDFDENDSFDDESYEPGQYQKPRNAHIKSSKKYMKSKDPEVIMKDKATTEDRVDGRKLRSRKTPKAGSQESSVDEDSSSEEICSKFVRESQTRNFGDREPDNPANRNRKHRGMTRDQLLEMRRKNYHHRNVHKSGTGSSKSNNPFPCSFCDRIFYMRRIKQGHEQQEHREELNRLHQLNVTCTEPGCGKVFTTPKIRNQHVRKVHYREPAESLNLICGTCGKSFRTRDRLKQHMRYHEFARNPSDMYKCTFAGCDKSYGNPWYLKTHIQTRHTNVRSYLCSYCGRSFLHNSDWHRHIRTLHPEAAEGHPGAEKPVNEAAYECEQCGKCFTRKDNLKQHLRSKAHGGVGHRPK